MVRLTTIAARFSPLLNAQFRLTNKCGEKLHIHKIGALGERIAARWLQREGCKILYRNFKAPQGGEVDIVARKGRVLLFIEVKTRTSTGRGRPLEAVDRDKQQLIERGGNEWLKLLGNRDIPWRYDVLEVYLLDGEQAKVTWVKDAF